MKKATSDYIQAALGELDPGAQAGWTTGEAADLVFPAHAGMNRRPGATYASRGRVPRARGAEPLY